MKIAATQLIESNNFDFYRLLAATLVVYSHCYALLGITGEPLVAATGGKEALGGFSVAFFFVISGFLITRSWLNEPNVVVYAMSRALRIVPGLAFSTIFSLFVIGPLSTTLKLRHYFRDPQTWSYLNNALVFPLQAALPGCFPHNPIPNAVNGSLWTLPVESYMYIVVLMFGLLGILARRHLVLLITAAAIIVDIFWVNRPEMTNVVYFGLVWVPTFKLAIYFLMGALCYLYRDRIVFTTPLALTFTALFVCSFCSDYFRQISYLVLPYVFFYVCAVPSRLCKTLTSKGDFSYGVYVFGFPFTQLLVQRFGVQQNVFALFAEAFALTLLMACVSWHMIESPALKLKKKLRRMLTPAVAQQAVAATQPVGAGRG